MAKNKDNKESKKPLTWQMLEHLMICAPTVLIGALFIPYGQSFGRALREAEHLAERCPHDFSNHSRETISATLSRMKKRKFVTVSGPNKKAIWRITTNGKRHFKMTKNDFELLPEDGKTRIVVFDIPENRHGERNWLRKQLLACDFTSLQKSVFIGTRPLPEKLLKEFKDRELTQFVHIMGLDSE